MNNKNTLEERRARFLHLRTVEKMSLRAIGKMEGVSGSYVAQVIGNTGNLRPMDGHLKAVHAFICNYTNNNGFRPSIDDIAQAFPNKSGVAPSSSNVSYWLDKLRDAGLIERTPRISRGIRVL